MITETSKGINNVLTNVLVKSYAEKLIVNQKEQSAVKLGRMFEIKQKDYQTERSNRQKF